MSLKDKNLYYIGGVVRDEMLGVTSVDTDYCYEGNALEFANGMNVIRSNDLLGTVRILTDEGEVDIASTRTEIYPQKGHLPQVVKIGCPLKEDLKRRDFTINAMAKRTTDGELIDYFNGKDDLKNKKLRVLHKESFIDDPTRIIRGLKFSVRFGFELEEETKKLQDDYLNNVNYDMSYFRLKKELMDAFNLNKSEVLDKFIDQKMYKLLGDEQSFVKVNSSEIEKLLHEYDSEYVWLVYLGFFNLKNLPLTRAEKRILDWAKRLETEHATNNTPLESVIINRLRESLL